MSLEELKGKTFSESDLEKVVEPTEEEESAECREIRAGWAVENVVPAQPGIEDIGDVEFKHAIVVIIAER